MCLDSYKWRSFKKISLVSLLINSKTQTSKSLLISQSYVAGEGEGEKDTKFLYKIHRLVSL